MQDWFNMQKSINVIHHHRKLKKKSYNHVNDTEKANTCSLSKTIKQKQKQNSGLSSQTGGVDKFVLTSSQHHIKITTELRTTMTENHVKTS